MYNMIGNAWEWVADEYTPGPQEVRCWRWLQPMRSTHMYPPLGSYSGGVSTVYGMSRFQPPSQEKKYVLRGGSYLDSVDGKTNHPVRVTTR
jgi:formylglycine-generating enzyme required for sulfatase activity